MTSATCAPDAPQGRRCSWAGSSPLRRVQISGTFADDAPVAPWPWQQGVIRTGALNFSYGFLGRELQGREPPMTAEAQIPQWITDWLSPPRLGRYLALTSPSNSRQTLLYYEWNLRLSSAFMRDVAHIEIALRNAYDCTMRRLWGGDRHWLLDPLSPVSAPLHRNRSGRSADMNSGNRRSIAAAVQHCRGRDITPDAIIAELPFGFWRHCGDSAHEATLWVPYLRHAWPSGTSRVEVDRALMDINTMRNRAALHEPMFGHQGRDLRDAYENILMLADMLLPELGEYIRKTSTVLSTLAEQRRPPMPPHHSGLSYT